MAVTPESMQYLLGIHPDQIAAEQAFVSATQGDSSGLNGDDNSGIKAYRDDGTPTEVARTGTAPNGRPTLGIAPVASPGDASPKPDAAPAAPPISKPSSYNPLTQPIRQQIAGDQNREAQDRAEMDRLKTTGSGVQQFQHKHHIFGPIVRGLDIAGSIIAPGVAANIPGTTLHHDQLVNEQEGRIAQDEKDQAAHFNMFDRIEANRMRDERETQANQKFVAGTEREDSNSPTGYTAQTVGGEFKPYTPPQTYKQTAGDKLNDEVKARTAQADKMGLTGDDRKFYIANGKLKEPGVNVHVPSAEKEHYDDVKEAFKKQYGHYPQTGDDFDTFNRMLKGEHGGGSRANQKTFKDSAAIDKYSNDWYAKQRKAVLDEKAKVKALNPDAADDDEKLQAEFKRIEDQYSQNAAQFEQQKKNWYAQLKAGRPVTVDDSGEVPEEENESGIPKPEFDVRTGRPIEGQPAGELTPLQEKEMKTPGGRVVKIGDKNPRTGQVVKGFAKNAKGDIVATY